MRHNHPDGSRTETYLGRLETKPPSRTPRARFGTACTWVRNGVFSNSVSRRYAGLLIPRSQVRSLSGPLRASVDAVRIDKWLWAARFFKTRGLAAKAVLTGRVEVNGERVKPSRLVRAGEMVAVTKGTEHWTVAVTGVTDRRGPAAVAKTLYSETAESRANREQRALEPARSPGDDLGARPTKRARRRLDALRRGRRTR
jgi:ribosome-associated heat shock protein Hsp15